MNSIPSATRIEKFLGRSLSTLGSMVCTAKFEKLPELAKPGHYSIKLVPDLQTFEFDGDEEIDLKVSQDYFL